MTTKSAAKKLRATLREIALTYPEAHEDFPWGESVIKVRGKIFLFLGVDGSDEVGFGVKLPHSGDIALSLPFFKPTGYGLGKSGWVQAKLGPDDELPLDMLREWLDESYRAVAPKRLSASLSAQAPTPAAKAKPAAKTKPVAKTKPAAKVKAAVKAKPKVVAKAKVAAKPKLRG